ncbi:DNA topoisomerase IV [Lutimonas halocynthiae]|uniref:DNA topoisomerase IV n=1 Tax=Lutimonas halocynthiae TaxID=1446477 RepID=UPI0025B4137D|nr:DNA topoisomerase IV [Lutimonas halocynthiae]MDN3644284.1 DNA topoisomerase IV [Lutimonas halocynthiae]
MRYFAIIILFLATASCLTNSNIHVDELKYGSFETTLEDKETISYAIRNDSIQIEDFNGIKDTFNIKWIDQFEYVLVKKNPKTMLDSTPFHVKITGIKNNTYTFNAYYKGSNFKQKGTAVKLN